MFHEVLLFRIDNRRYGPVWWHRDLMETEGLVPQTD